MLITGILQLSWAARLNSQYFQFLVVGLIFFIAGIIWSRVQLTPEMRLAKYNERPQLKLLIPSQIAFQDVIESFQAQNRVRLDVTTFDSPSDLEKHMASQEPFDVIGLYSHQVSSLSHSGQLAKLDKKLIPNLANISPDFQRNKFDPEGDYSAAISWGINGVVVNTSEFKEHPKSWSELVSNKLVRKVALSSTPYEVVANLVRRDLFEWEWLLPDRKDFLSKQIKSLSKQLTISPSEFEEKMISGELWVVQTTNGRAAHLSAKDSKFEFVVPKEGATLWVHTLSISSISRQKELAHKFIDYLLQEEVALETVEFLKEASANKTVEYAPIDNRLKPSFIRTISLNKLEFPRDLSAHQKWINQLIFPEKKSP